MKEKELRQIIKEEIKKVISEKLYPQNEWWKNDPAELLTHIYWLQGKVPPSNPSKRAKAWKDLVTQMNSNYKAPYKDFNRMLHYKF